MGTDRWAQAFRPALGILLPRKITVKGAFGVATAMAQAPPLSAIFPGKIIGAYQEDGPQSSPTNSDTGRVSVATGSNACLILSYASPALDALKDKCGTAHA
jgi:hypothetical protein